MLCLVFEKFKGKCKKKKVKIKKLKEIRNNILLYTHLCIRITKIRITIVISFYPFFVQA